MHQRLGSSKVLLDFSLKVLQSTTCGNQPIMAHRGISHGLVYANIGKYIICKYYSTDAHVYLQQLLAKAVHFVSRKATSCVFVPTAPLLIAFSNNPAVPVFNVCPVHDLDTK